MSAYYNEIDPYATQWLRNLVAAGHIAPGDVDERSIVDVRSDDLRPYRQCHFFAGIGGWAYALRLAGWDDERDVWTGSCPCQPLSVAGQRQGHADQRHLWPAFYALIAECRPATVFGEQVASKDGREWLAAVRADLEACGYAVGAADLPAAGVGAPHIRRRLWWVAHSRRVCGWGSITGTDSAAQGRREEDTSTVGSNSVGELGYAERNGSGRDTRAGIEAQGGAFVRAERDGARSSSADAGELADASCGRCQEQRPSGNSETAEFRSVLVASGNGPQDPWSDVVWLPCTDGKARPTQSGIFPLAHGVSARVGRLRAYGNAIVPQVAAEFIKASSSVTQWPSVLRPLSE